MGRPLGSVSEGSLSRGNSTSRVLKGATCLAYGQRKGDGLGSNEVRELCQE